MINNYLGLSECVCAHEFVIGAMSAKNTVCSGKVSHRTLSTFEVTVPNNKKGQV